LVAASILPLVAGCARLRGAGVADGRDAAFLLPLSGEASALGRNMARAASLVVTPAPGGGQPPVYDTLDTLEGAGAAAETALTEGARMLLGPLRADQTPAVLAVAGRAPVVTFSNDDRLAGGGAFVMGVTPAQSVDAAFSYAREQGVRRVAVVAVPSPLAEASIVAARALAEAGGMTLTAALQRDPSAGGLAGALSAASGGALPDAVFLPDGGPELLAFADALAGEVQLLGGVQWGIEDAAASPALEGAWFAAPPPDSFVPFLDTFEARFGESGGVVTALGHDAARMAAELGGAGRLNRAGLTREEGFVGALGRFRFLPDGRCERDLTVLTIEDGRIVAIGEVTGT
jgi:ABC-type branched-subunit amino acid transport system substrate-binding protein